MTPIAYSIGQLFVCTYHRMNDMIRIVTHRYEAVNAGLSYKCFDWQYVQPLRVAGFLVDLHATHWASS
eukprot:scaffold55350_cov20-Prasinocladus_malaysianus.AAC.1